MYSRVNDIKKKVVDYVSYHDDNNKSKIDYKEMVKNYYDLATDFYEYGWGSSFHFAKPFVNESYEDAIKRHEYLLGVKLQLDKNKKCLDIGCGVAGPLRNIARMFDTNITGININEYQIKKARNYIEKDGLSDCCKIVNSDFMKMSFDNESFDCAYAIEATCHSSDPVGCYSEINRVIKKNGYFALYEWCLTDNFDKENPEHLKIKKDIEIGDGLPNIISTQECLDSLKKAGFEIIEYQDLATNHEDNEEYKNKFTSWYSPLEANFSFNGFKHTVYGRYLTSKMVGLLEKFTIMPSGASQIHDSLLRGADGLVEGGKRKIFTPMFYVLAKKI